jgi:iduronate 2-sulfatase
LVLKNRILILWPLKKYWDMYDREDIQLAKQKKGPIGGATTGLHASFELRTRHGIPKEGSIGEELAKTLLHGYYACVSYVDAQVGLMIDAFRKGGESGKILLLWSGVITAGIWGEMGIWGRATNYEIATRVPLIFWTPGMKQRGKGTEALVELVDLYPNPL